MKDKLIYFSGDLLSSFTTEQEYDKNIRHTEQSTSHLILCGNTVISNIEFHEYPLTQGSVPPLKIGEELSFVEFRDKNPSLSKRRNIFDYTISSISIGDFQKIDGVSHGTLSGKITGSLVKRDAPTPIVQKPEEKIEGDTMLVPGTDGENLSARKGCGANPLTNNTSLGQNKGCGKFFTPRVGVANRGCGNVPIPGIMPNGCRNSGCWSILSYLIWVPLLFSLFKFCDNSEQEDRNMPKVEDNKKDYWDDNPEEDFGIDSTKQLDDTYEIQYKSILLPNVQFFTNRDKILESSKKELDELSLYFNDHQELKGIINGYTDSRGNEERNLRLSQKRAEAVMHYLIEKGVQSNRLSAIGKGESNAKASNKLAEGRLMNRRVEITIIKKVKRK